MYNKDYYGILGLTPDASEREIKSAYRKFAMQYHPDRNRDDPKSVEKLKEINDAYHVLGNKEKRMAYDLMHHRPRGDGAFHEKDFMQSDLDTIFHMFATKRFKGSGRPFCKRRGSERRRCGRHHKL